MKAASVCTLVVLAAAAAAAAVVPRVSLHPAGPEVSAMGWGHLSLHELQTPAAVVARLHQASALGLTTLDTADIYPPRGEFGANVRLLGAAFAAEPGLREDFEIVAKFGIVSLFPYQVNTTGAYIRQAVDWYLANLGVSRLDVALLHQFNPLTFDPVDIATTFVDLVTAGKVGYFGVSNFPPEAYGALAAIYPLPLVTNEVEFSVLAPEVNVPAMAQLAATGAHALAWGPLGGDPTGPPPESGEERCNRVFDRTRVRRNVRLIRAAEAIAAEIATGASADDVLLAYVAAHPAAPLPLIGTMNADRMDSQVTGMFTKVLPFLTPDHWNTLNDLATAPPSL